MKKLYKTKYQLLFSKPDIQESLRLRLNEFTNKYGNLPRRIIVDETDWIKYEASLPLLIQKHYSRIGYSLLGNKRLLKKNKKGVPSLTYRGIPIVEKDNWINRKL